MVSAKRLAQLAKKWQRMAAFKRKRLTTAKDEMCCISVAVKGHCVMYTANGMHFEVALVCLSTTMELSTLRRLASQAMARSHCLVMKYVMCLHRRNATVEVENVLLSSMVNSVTTLAAQFQLLEPASRLAVCSS